MKRSPLVLIVDDDAEIAIMLSRSLTHRGFQVSTTGSPEEALRLAEQSPFEAALLDLVMPEKDGVALATALRERIQGLPVAILTGYPHSPLITAARRFGVFVFRKPTPIQDLVDFLESEIPKKVDGEPGTPR
jgi:two-component system response regulator GlrR